MQGFPFDRFRILVMSVERPNEQLKALLKQHGYHYLRLLSNFGEVIFAHADLPDLDKWKVRFGEDKYPESCMDSTQYDTTDLQIVWR
mmetsp:Transcript_68897/g.224506  ORF Transcript_68897/g.224506 Transcript_68897/m.224506 type:complete len:87 (-) Transcript_68897:81-341(-)